MSDNVESMLSRTRLELLDKRREVRDVVRDNYKQLVGVSSHASASSARCAEVLTSFERIVGLSKNLRLKAASVQINGPSPNSRAIGEHRGHVEDSELNHVHACLSMSARVLFHSQKFEFGVVSNLLDKYHSDQPSDEESNRLLAQFLEDNDVIRRRVQSYCIRALGSILMNSRQRCLDCVSLLKKVCSPTDDLESIFWSRRSALLDSIIQTNAPAIQAVIHYDLSCGVASECAIPVPTQVHARYGTADGAIGIALFEEIHRCSSLRLLSQIYRSMREQFSQSRIYMHSDLASIIIDPIVKQVTELLVRSVIANQLDLSLHDSEWRISNLNDPVETLIRDCETDLHQLFTENETLRVIGQEIGKQLVAACVSSRQVPSIETNLSRTRIINVSKILACLNSSGQTTVFDVTETTTIPFKRSIAPLLGIDAITSTPGLDRIADFVETIPKLEIFVSEECVTFWNYVCQEYRPPNIERVVGYTVMNSSEIRVPFSPSPGVQNLIFPISIALVDMPSFVHHYAISSARQFVLERLAAFDKSLQGLFDLNWVLTIVSSADDDMDDRYKKLAGSVYSEIESVALSDAVDRAIYKDLIKRAAYIACHRNRVVLAPFISRGNPRYMHGFPNVNMDEIRVVEARQKVEPLDSVVERFQILPLAKTGAVAVKKPPFDNSRRGSVQSASAAASSLNAATNSVTSFFNSVGSKITLGSK